MNRTLAKRAAAWTTVGAAVGTALVAAFIPASPARAVGAAPKAASGETQIVARAGGRELTLSQLRLEMARLRLSPSDPDAERVALESLVNRTVIAAAARKAKLHRRPETIARMHAAQDAALVELYIASAAQPAEPTRADIEAYIEARPAVFAERRAYTLSVLTLETKYFDEQTLTPLFDEEADFSRLAGILEKAGADYSIAASVQPSTAFAEPIREQLAQYDVRDNIVLKGGDQTQILKIMEIRPVPIPEAERPALARRLIMEEAAAGRAREIVARLKAEAEVEYFRASAAPRPDGRTDDRSDQTALTPLSKPNTER